MSVFPPIDYPFLAAHEDAARLKPSTHDFSFMRLNGMVPKRRIDHSTGVGAFVFTLPLFESAATYQPSTT
jgi:hypothetical protein